jgi:hypothetical protein
MDTAGCEPQVFVPAAKVKGEVSCAPFEGDATVIADAGIALLAKRSKPQSGNFI